MTNAEFAILSLIAEQPRHGYEIEQVIEQRGMRNWTEVGFSSIYYLLKKLEKAGYVSSHTEVVAGRGPARKIFAVTDSGVAACRTATLEALQTPHRCYPPIQLGLSNLPSLMPNEATDALKQHRAGVAERLAGISQTRDAESHPDHARMMFGYSIAILTAQINWLDEVIQALEVQ